MRPECVSAPSHMVSASSQRRHHSALRALLMRLSGLLGSSALICVSVICLSVFYLPVYHPSVCRLSVDLIGWPI
jgi:hypothetical protein